MKEIIAVFDTNFFVGLIENTDGMLEFVDFMEQLQSSYDENNIRPVIPRRVVSEVETFDLNIARFLEYTFPVHTQIDINNDAFYLNIKRMNMHRHKHKRWFNLSETVDLAVLAVAKNIFIHDICETGRQDISEVWIISNDEGIQKVAARLLKKQVKVLEPAAFLSYLLGVSNDRETREILEDMSKRVFKHFTGYRLSSGRQPVSQLDNFFSEMLNSISMARSDMQMYFEDTIVRDLERHVIQGKELPSLYAPFKDALALIRDILALDEDSLRNELDARFNELFFALNSLSAKLNEPANYTRFYNYISNYLFRVFINAFKLHFMEKSLDEAFKYLAFSKLLIQSFFNRPNLSRLYFSIVLVEIAFCYISNYKSEKYINSNVMSLIKAVDNGQIPSLISMEQVNLLVFVSHCKNNNKVDLVEDDDVYCKFDENSFYVSTGYLPSLIFDVEDFCDELTSFGNHPLAIKVLSGLYPLLTKDGDIHKRVEGKIYLNCIIIDETYPSCTDDDFSSNWEKTYEKLGEEYIHKEFTPIEDVDEAYTKRIKILNYNKEEEAYRVWVYPIKSKFKLIIPKHLLSDTPQRLKEVKILEGSIKVIPLPRQECETRDLRGIIEISEDANLKMYYYKDKFFSLDII